MRRSGVAFGLLAVAVATSSWNAVALGPVKLTHVALAAALPLLFARTALRGRAVHVPSWVWVLGGAIVLTAVTTFIWPPSPAYFARRYVEDIPDPMAAIDSLGTASAVGALQWLVAAVGLPVAVCLAVRLDGDRSEQLGHGRTLAASWVGGVSVNALVALADGCGLTSISTAVLGMPDQVGRQAGLSVHPNHLAIAIVMALPVVVLWIVRARDGASAAVRAAVGAVLLAGLLTTGSRAGLGGAVLAVFVALACERRGRRLIPVLAGLGAIVTALAVAVVPGLLVSVARELRLAGADTAAESDEIRAGYAAQAIADFAHAPWHGVGFEVVAQGHDIYLQLLASGGVLLLLGYLAAQLGFITTTWTADDGGSGLARALVVAGGSFLVVGVVQNQVVDLFVAVPSALAAGLWAADREGVAAARTTRAREYIPELQEVRA